MKRKILLTGATGFVGRQVVSKLSEFETDLRLIVRSGAQAAAKHLTPHKDIVETDDLFAESADWWAVNCEGVDTVIHLAWYTEPGNYLESTKNMDCLSGSIALATGAVRAGVRRFLGIGTCFEYDLTADMLSVETPLRPISPYADAKAALYLSLSHWLPLQAVEFTWCRIFYLFGEGEDSRRLVPYLRSRLSKGKVAELTSGKQVRDFLDVAEASAMIVRVALGDQIGPINICSGVPITVRQLAERIADEYGCRDLLVFGARGDNPVDPPYVVGVPNTLYGAVDI